MSMTPGRDSRAPESPWAAASVIERSVIVITVVVLAGLAGIAWYATIGRAREMTEMVTGLGHIGSRISETMSAPLFLGMWVTMMVAMMFPTIAPMVLIHRRVVVSRGEGNLPTIAFVLGYLVIWSAVGVVPTAIFLLFGALASHLVDGRISALLAGTILIGAGLYQFTPWKALCQRACRSPFSFVMQHDFRKGAPGAFHAGLSHGLYCLGCCWALMAVLVVVGIMNLVWMAALTLVFLAEKNWRHGVTLTRIVGVGLAVVGLAVVAFPHLLRVISAG